MEADEPSAAERGAHEREGQQDAGGPLDHLSPHAARQPCCCGVQRAASPRRLGVTDAKCMRTLGMRTLGFRNSS